MDKGSGAAIIEEFNLRTGRDVVDRKLCPRLENAKVINSPFETGGKVSGNTKTLREITRAGDVETV